MNFRGIFLDIEFVFRLICKFINIKCNEENKYEQNSYNLKNKGNV